MSIPRIRCPNPECARELWDDNSPYVPEAGALNVCIYCLQVMRFTSATEVQPTDSSALDPFTRLRRITAGRFCMYCELPMEACIARKRCGRTKPPPPVKF